MSGESPARLRRQTEHLFRSRIYALCMSGKTTRDQIWTVTLNRTHRGGELVTAADVAEHAGCSKRTARDTLHVMENNAFIERERRGSKVGFVKPSGGI